MREVYDELSQGVAKGLVRLIAELKQAYKTYELLAEAIQTANAAARPPLDRRKLSTIAKAGADPRQIRRLPLTLEELGALDVFLRSIGHGDLSSALSATPSVLKAAAEARRIAFLMGAKPMGLPEVEPSDFISRWDFHASLTLSRMIDRIGPGVQIEMVDCYLGDMPAREVRRRWAGFSGQDWYRRLKAEDGQSVICIGSPRSCHAAEIMLAQMFGVEPFVRLGDAGRPQMPFSFVWSDRECLRLQSACAMAESQVPERKSLRSRGFARAMRIYKEFLPVHNADARWTTYGIIAAQRRPGGQIWIVCAGLSGPGTFGCAKCLDCMNTDFPATRAGDIPPVFWSVVAVDVRQRSAKEQNTGVDERQIERIGWYTSSEVAWVNVYHPQMNGDH